MFKCKNGNLSSIWPDEYCVASGLYIHCYPIDVGNVKMMLFTYYINGDGLPFPSMELRDGTQSVLPGSRGPDFGEQITFASLENYTVEDIIKRITEK